MDQDVRQVLHRIVGTAQSRSIDTEQRVRDYHAQVLGGRQSDYDNIKQLLAPLTEHQKQKLWDMLFRDITEQSNWKVYELRFLMQMFDVDAVTIRSSNSPPQPKIAIFDDDIDDIELGHINE